MRKSPQPTPNCLAIELAHVEDERRVFQMFELRAVRIDFGDVFQGFVSMLCSRTIELE